MLAVTAIGFFSYRKPRFFVRVLGHLGTASTGAY
jgi:hypothetical protein